MLRNLSQAQLDAETNSNVVHATNWAAAQAGEPGIDTSAASCVVVPCLVKSAVSLQSISQVADTKGV